MKDKPLGETKVYLDSSVVIAGLASPKGGSGLILSLIKARKLVGIISPPVIEETKRNIKDKLGPKLLENFNQLLSALVIQEDFRPRAILKYQNLVAIKDLHVLVFAESSKANYLITLDRKHLKTPKLQKVKLPFKIFLPKEFLEELSAAK